jgi:hypothetical protein
LVYWSCKSISNGAEYVIWTVKLDEENPKYAGLARKWFWLSIISQFGVAGIMCSSAVHLLKRV